MGDCLWLVLSQRKNSFNFDEAFIKMFDWDSDIGYIPQADVSIIIS